MGPNGYIYQILLGTIVTLKLSGCALLVGLGVGLVGALLESIPWFWLRYPLAGLIFIVRGLPELLVLFFIYFGATAMASAVFHHYVEISAFAAGVIALGLIFGAYSSQVFRGAFLAIDAGQVEAGKAMGFSRTQLITRIQLPQAWRHAIPGIGNLWLVLLKDSAIVALIGLTDMMGQAKIAAATTHQPFFYYMFAALIYLLITSVSQKFIHIFSARANRYIPL
jgi:arginine transport system permease protein